MGLSDDGEAAMSSGVSFIVEVNKAGDFKGIPSVVAESRLVTEVVTFVTPTPLPSDA